MALHVLYIHVFIVLVYSSAILLSVSDSHHCGVIFDPYFLVFSLEFCLSDLLLLIQVSG